MQGIFNEKHSTPKKFIVSVGALVIVSATAGFVGGYFGAKSEFGTKNAFDGDNKQVVSSEGELISDIANEVGPSVVSINVFSRTVEDSFFGPRSVTQKSAGTGFVISRDGVILTNRHVIESGGRSDISVTLSDGTELDDVEVIGTTASYDPLDIGFLKINDAQGKELKPVEIGDSSEVEVGDKVIAIGNALGQFQNTVTSGIISGYGRNVIAQGSSESETLQNLFQTDAAINQGNSGGPLVNFDGEVIGVTTAVAGGSAQNISFAIPIDDVRGLTKSVLEEGKLLRPFLGIRYVSITDDIAFENELDRKRGAYILPSRQGEPSIISGSAADKAGLREGDIITHVGDTKVDERNSLTSILGSKSVGEKIELTVVRDGKEIKLNATLQAAPAD